MDLIAFFQNHFIQPILQNGWFNSINTSVYAIILIISVFLVYKLLIKLNVKIDYYFTVAILPFIFWGSSTRVLHDAAVRGVLSPELNSIYIAPIFPTPGSYIITFTLALFVLLISLTIQRFLKYRYWRTMFAIGLGLCAINVYFLPVLNFYRMFMILGFVFLFTGIFTTPKLINIMRPYFTNVNIAILGAHFLDASATFVSMSFFGYSEQHVVPRLLINLLGPWVMFLLKIVIVIPALVLIDRYTEESNFRNFLKIVILILGLAPGLRDTIRLMAMV